MISIFNLFCLPTWLTFVPARATLGTLTGWLSCEHKGGSQILNSSTNSQVCVWLAKVESSGNRLCCIRVRMKTTARRESYHWPEAIIASQYERICKFTLLAAKRMLECKQNFKWNHFCVIPFAALRTKWLEAPPSFSLQWIQVNETVFLIGQRVREKRSVFWKLIIRSGLAGKNCRLFVCTYLPASWWEIQSKFSLWLMQFAARNTWLNIDPNWLRAAKWCESPAP